MRNIKTIGVAGSGTMGSGIPKSWHQTAIASF